MEAAIEVLRRKKGRRIAVLGDMKELGDFSESLHMKTGKLLNGIDILIAFGNYNSHYIEGAIEAGLSENNCYDCKTAEDAASVLFNIAEPGDYILVKSSRSMNGEKILSEFFDKHA